MRYSTISTGESMYLEDKGIGLQKGFQGWTRPTKSSPIKPYILCIWWFDKRYEPRGKNGEMFENWDSWCAFFMIWIVVYLVSKIFCLESVPWYHLPNVGCYLFFRGEGNMLFLHSHQYVCSWDASVSYWNSQLSKAEVDENFCIAAYVVYVVVFGDPVLQISFGCWKLLENCRNFLHSHWNSRKFCVQ